MALRACALQTVEDCRVPLAPVKSADLARAPGSGTAGATTAIRLRKGTVGARAASPFAAALAKARKLPDSGLPRAPTWMTIQVHLSHLRVRARMTQMRR